MKVTAIIPVYNESDIIGVLLDYLIRQGINIYLLDNESTDNTVQIARTFPSHMITIESFHSGNLFHEKLFHDAIRSAVSKIDADWIFKNDADEFIETPWEGVCLIDGIKIAHNLGYNCLGVVSYQFYPMSDEQPHEFGSDVREHYDYCQLWNKVDRWEPHFHPRYKELWKVNMFKNHIGITFVDSHILKIPEEVNIRLFPELFELRHYPYRHPDRTYKRLVHERKERMALHNIENNICNHYTKYNDTSSFIKKKFTFDCIKSECRQWSRHCKASLPQWYSLHRDRLCKAGHPILILSSGKSKECKHIKIN